VSATIADGVVFTVEIGFSTSAGSGTVPINSTLASITWTDVSSYVRSVSTNRGRSTELDTFQAGSASITLSNADRRFDPEHASGPYFGSLTPLRPIRIRAQYGAGATTNLFFGWIDQWPQSYNNPTDATVTITASDAFKVLNLLTLKSYWEYIQYGNRWWRMDGETGSTTLFDSANKLSSGSWKTAAGAATSAISTSGLVLYDDNNANTFDGNRYAEFTNGQMSATLGGDFANSRSVGALITTTTTTNGNYGIFKAGDDNRTIVACGMVVSGGVGTIRAWIGSTSTGLVSVINSPIVVNDGKVHHVRVQVNNDGLVGAITGLIVDDDIASTAVTTSTITPDGLESIGKPMNQLANATYRFANVFVGTIDEVVSYSYLDTSPFIGDFINEEYQIALAIYTLGQSVSSRIDEVLQAIGWMSDANNVGTSSGTMGLRDWQNKSVLGILQECEECEQGRLFIDANGKVAQIGRNVVGTTTIYKTSQRTYGDSTGELGYTNISFSYNDQLIKNRIRVQRVNGATAISADSTSQTQYFVRTEDVGSLPVNTDQQVVDIANARLAQYKQPALRVDSITVNPRQSASTLYPAVIGDEIGTRITVNRRPQGVGSVISKDLRIEGISHSITPDAWSTTYSLSPVTAGPFILNDNAFGVLNTNLLGY
jgi:hypothetical protein